MGKNSPIGLKNFLRKKKRCNWPILPLMGKVMATIIGTGKWHFPIAWIPWKRMRTSNSPYMGNSWRNSLLNMKWRSLKTHPGAAIMGWKGGKATVAVIPEEIQIGHRNGVHLYGRLLIGSGINL